MKVLVSLAAAGAASALPLFGEGGHGQQQHLLGENGAGQQHILGQDGAGQLKPMLGANGHGIQKQPMFGSDGHGIQKKPMLGADGHGIQKQPMFGSDGHGIQKKPMLGANGHGIQKQPMFGSDGHGIQKKPMLGADGHGTHKDILEGLSPECEKQIAQAVSDLEHLVQDVEDALHEPSFPSVIKAVTEAVKVVKEIEGTIATCKNSTDLVAELLDTAVAAKAECMMDMTQLATATSMSVSNAFLAGQAKDTTGMATSLDQIKTMLEYMQAAASLCGVDAQCIKDLKAVVFDVASIEKDLSEAVANHSIPALAKVVKDLKALVDDIKTTISDCKGGKAMAPSVSNAIVDPRQFIADGSCDYNGLLGHVSQIAEALNNAASNSDHDAVKYIVASSVGPVLPAVIGAISTC